MIKNIEETLLCFLFVFLLARGIFNFKFNEVLTTLYIYFCTGCLGQQLLWSERNASKVFVELLRGRDGLPGRDGLLGKAGPSGNTGPQGVQGPPGVQVGESFMP